MKVEEERLRIIQGDALEKLRELPDEVCHCVCTSPPYWGLRDYGIVGQLGLEKTPDEYIAKMVAVFEEVRRVLRNDGTLWLNCGDTYNAGRNGGWAGGTKGISRPEIAASQSGVNAPGLKPKDLCGIPWRLAFALQAAGWWLRSDIIWAKPNPMPESVTDRPTKSHEYVFLLSKASTYFYDAEAVKERSIDPESLRLEGRNPRRDDKFAQTLDENRNGMARTRAGFRNLDGVCYPTRNKRTVWEIPTEAFPDAHFATFPTGLVKPCILAGTSARGCCPKCGAPWERVVEKVKGLPESFNGSDFRKGKKALSASALAAVGQQERTAETKTTGWQPTCQHGEDPSEVRSPIPCTVLDPFAGSFTTCAVALELGRRAIGIELNPKYVEMGKRRCDVTPGLPLA